MKVRNGFVSNSSSSSFICEISGEVESGMDLSYSDVGFCQCENYHTFLEQYLDTEKRDKIVELVENDSTEELAQLVDSDRVKHYIKNIDDISSNCDLPIELCPICTLKEIRECDTLKYLLKVNSKTKEEIDNEIRANFKDLANLEEYLK